MNTKRCRSRCRTRTERRRRQVDAQSCAGARARRLASLVGLVVVMTGQPSQAAEPHSTARVVPDGHGEGRDLVVIDWKTTKGQPAGRVEVPVTGAGRTGPVSVKLEAIGSVPNAYEWDTREWQWWKDCAFDPGQMRPRENSVTTGGVDRQNNIVRVWSQYLCDGVLTTQEWFFRDLEQPDRAMYDCLITVTNQRGETLEEYGQFFACYTDWNTEKGHFYVDRQGNLVNYRDRGGEHLDYYVTAKGSPFDRLGYVPHCPRGGGKVRDNWKYPVSVSQPSRDGYRHIVMTEEARTASIAQGMEGVAQDYLIYPPGGRLDPDETFRVHVRHWLVKLDAEDLPQQLDRRWNDFRNEHDLVHKLSLAGKGNAAE